MPYPFRRKALFKYVKRRDTVTCKKYIDAAACKLEFGSLFAEFSLVFILGQSAA